MEKVFFEEIPEVPMTEITLQLEPTVVLFYTRIATAAGRSLEQVLSDALFKLAGELSLESMRQQNNFQKSL